ncbi:hypothetical protein [Paenibacillus mucilaginosus]|uniref:hypothetical protein n=1 Tax=Paenibacillus mucilaginosus TaxID=61624 RepID=UPI001180A42C|nr:hypothetical protein [Paenibacillus mucilaginosus]MCG7211627.1 hypothetical protein [Paenibacillus mucilaginosus]WDM30013.1 hypothetical protein KCX80_13060 [Paenibacillus mucilaginosus]
MIVEREEKSSGLEIQYNEGLRVSITAAGEEEPLALRRRAFQAVLTELVWSVREPGDPASERQQKELWTWILHEIGWALTHASPFRAESEEDPLAVLAAAVGTLREEAGQEGPH